MRWIVFLSLLGCLSAMAAPSRNVETQDQYFKNLLVDPGFENGIGSWTCTASRLPNSSTVGDGDRSLTMNATGSLQDCQQTVTVPKSMRGTKGFARLSSNTASSNYNLIALSGSNIAGSTFIAPKSNSTFGYTELEFLFNGAQSTATLMIQGNSIPAGAITLDKLYLGGSTVSGADSITNDFSTWYVNAVITTGTNDVLALTDQSGYVVVTDTEYSLAAITGSQPVGISCASAASIIGNGTCTGTESLGATFSIPRAGVYQVCANFVHNINSAVTASSDGRSGVAFTWQEVSSALSSTIIQGGATVGFPAAVHGIQSNANSINSDTTTINLCQPMTFSSAGQKTIEMAYQVDDENANLQSHAILSNSNLTCSSANGTAWTSGCGNKGVLITVKPW